MNIIILFLFVLSFAILLSTLDNLPKTSIKNSKRESLLDDVADMTWTCHICHRERADKFISVYTYPLKGLKGASCNVRYCNDSFTCIENVKKWAKRGEFPR